jgi:hypothetical protein
VLWRVNRAGRTFSAPRHQTGRVLFPTSQRNRPVRVLVQVSKTRRAKREVDPHGEALTGRRVPQRPARPCGLEPADAGGPAPGVGGRAAAARRTPLESFRRGSSHDASSDAERLPSRLSRSALRVPCSAEWKASSGRLICVDCLATRGHGTGPYPAMSRAEMRAGLDLLPTWVLEQKVAAFSVLTCGRTDLLWLTATPSSRASAQRRAARTHGDRQDQQDQIVDRSGRWGDGATQGRAEGGGGARRRADGTQPRRAGPQAHLPRDRVPHAVADHGDRRGRPRLPRAGAPPQLRGGLLRAGRPRRGRVRRRPVRLRGWRRGLQRP